jgi:hypothetical protein
MKTKTSISGNILLSYLNIEWDGFVELIRYLQAFTNFESGYPRIFRTPVICTGHPIEPDALCG